MLRRERWHGPRSPHLRTAVEAATRAAMRCGTALEPTHLLVEVLSDMRSMGSALVAATGEDPSEIAATLRRGWERLGPHVERAEPSVRAEHVLLLTSDLAASSGAKGATTLPLLMAALEVEAASGCAVATRLHDSLG